MASCRPAPRLPSRRCHRSRHGRSRLQEAVSRTTRVDRQGSAQLRGPQWTNLDFDAGVIRVERSWDPGKGPVDATDVNGASAVATSGVPRHAIVLRRLGDQLPGV